jgi:hypothetical protein
MREWLSEYWCLLTALFEPWTSELRDISIVIAVSATIILMIMGIVYVGITIAVSVGWLQ